MNIPQKLAANFSADFRLITRHLLQLVPRLTACDECVCIFPEAGSANVEIQVLCILVETGVRVSRVYFMDGLYDTFVATPDLEDVERFQN